MLAYRIYDCVALAGSSSRLATSPANELTFDFDLSCEIQVSQPVRRGRSAEQHYMCAGDQGVFQCFLELACRVRALEGWLHG